MRIVRRVRDRVVRVFDRGSAALAELVRGERRPRDGGVDPGVLGVFVVLAIVFVWVKARCDGGIGTDATRQALLVVAAATVAYVVTGRPGAREFGQMLGLRPVDVDSDGEPARRAAAWVVAPLLLSLPVVVIGTTVFGADLHLTVERLVDLVVVVAFGEELLYRGAMLVIAYRAVGRWRGELATAIAFGLWHIPDALADSEGSSIAWRVATVAGQVVFTTAGGLVFSWMRHRTRSLAGPVAMHVATNLPGRAFGLR